MFELTKVEYKNRIGNLDVEASSKVKSKKYFPIFKIDNKEYIFKPLSKTKPFTTPLFSYAEVYWSNIIKNYFYDVPIYKLAFCNGYEESEEKYYNRGCLVPNILKEDEVLVNLYEYFRDNIDKKVNILDYTNYCIYFYDYTFILESKLFKENKQLGEDLSYQILLSILKADQNYHYENVSFICDKETKEIKRLAPVIDHEFSTMFLCLDKKDYQISFFMEYIQSLNNGVLKKNIEYIKTHYPNIVDKFLKQLKIFNDNFIELKIEENEFLCKCNSFSWQIGEARYKKLDEEKAKELEQIIHLENLNLDKVNDIINREIKWNIKKIIEVLS